MTWLAGIVIRASGLDLMAVTPDERAHWGRAVLADPGKRMVVSETFLFETLLLFPGSAKIKELYLKQEVIR
jgi:hypothetical protein